MAKKKKRKKVKSHEDFRLSKIKTAEEIEREKRRHQITIGIIMTLLLVLSIAGYSIMSNTSQENKRTEGGVDFVREGGLWKIRYQNKVFAFSYLPSQLASVEANGTYDLRNYVNKPLYFVGSNQAIPEIINNIGQYVLRYQRACLVGENCTDPLLPRKSCDGPNVIVFRSSPSSRIYQNGSCVFLEGDPIKTADKFIYELFNIRI